MPVNIEELQLSVESIGTAAASKGLNDTKKKLEELANAANEISKVNGSAISALSNLANSINLIANAGASPGLLEAVRQLRNLGSIDVGGIEALSKRVDELAEKINGLSTIKPATSTANADSTSGQTTGMSEMTKGFTGFTGQFHDFLMSMDAGEGKISNMADVMATGVVDGFHSITSGIAGSNESLGDFGTALGKVGGVVKGFYGFFGKLALDGFKAIGDKAKNAIKPIHDFIHSIGRIAMYRAIRDLLKQISEAFKTGTTDMYQYSKGINGSFAKAMDSISTEMLYFKNSIGAAVAPLITALAPAIEFVVDRVVEFINILNQLFAKLAGASFWTKALKYPKAYATAAKGATKANKGVLASFDELNILNSPSSGGASAASDDYSKMFTEQTNFDSGISSFVDQIKSSIAAGDWTGVGQIILDKINGFDAGSLGSSIANWFNKGINGIDFTVIGALLASKWKLATDFLYSFVTTFDWSSLGQAVSDGISGWLDEIDWNKVGDTIAQSINGVFNSIGTFLATMDWQKLADDLFNLLSSLIKNIDWMGLLATLGLALIEFAAGIPALLADALAGIMDGISKAFADAGDQGAAGFFKGISDFFDGIGDWLKKNIIDPFIDLFKKDLGIHSPSTVFAEIGKLCMQGLTGGFSKAWGTVKSVINGIITGIETMANSVVNGINKMIDALNKLNFTIPSWVPLLGGKSFGLNIKHVNPVVLTRLAEGGMVDQGQMFIAREAGPELVGNIGNKAGAINNDQITDAVAAAVVSGMSEVMRNNNGDLHVTINASGSQLLDVIVKEYAKYKNVTGKAVFAE